MPPCRPQKAFNPAAELTYVIGIRVVCIDHLGKPPHALFYLADVGHVGQRAPGAKVRQDHAYSLAPARGQALRPVGKNIGRLGHKVYAAKGDRPALVVRCRQRSELITVASKVAQRDHVVLLIVVP